MLLAVQVWGGLLAPLLLEAVAEARAYGRHRSARLRALLASQRRQQRDEDRRWTRAYAAARQQEAEALGLSLSDISTGSSGPNSPEAAQEAAAVDVAAAALAEAPAPRGLVLPEDWQYEASYLMVCRLRLLVGWGALPAGAVLCLLYAWHVLAYPWPA